MCIFYPGNVEVATTVELFVALIVLALFTVVWAMIFSKAGYSGWLALLMLIPVVNLIWLLIFAFSEWPIEAELARLGGRSPLERSQRRQLAGGLVIEEETIDPSIDEMFSRALKLDKRGDWAEAVALYEQIAEQVQGQQDGEYAANCAKQIREKMAKGA